MKKLLITTVLLLSGCAASVAPTPIDTKPPLNLRPAEPLKMRPVKLHVIHMGIAEKKFEEIRKSGEKPVVFALTGTDYKNLAVNVQRLKAYIKTQQRIINAYKKYYEGTQNGNQN
jgi:hypothetical protein